MAKAGIKSRAHGTVTVAIPLFHTKPTTRPTLMKLTPSRTLALLLAGVSLASAQDGSIRIIASSGTPALGQTGNFSAFIDPVLNGSGTVAFLGYTAGGQAIYTTSGTNLVALVVTGQSAPLINNTFNGFTAPLLNESGTVAFTGTTFAGGQAVYWTSGGALTTVAGTGQAQNFSTFPTALSLSDTGVLTFEADTGSPVVTLSGIYRGSGSTLTTIVNTSQAAPGTGGIFANPSAPIQNNVGMTAFFATTSIGQGIYTGLGGTPVAIVTTATAVPGIGGNFITLGNPAFNDSNIVAFKGGNASGTGIFTGTGGALSTIATTATAAPGLGGNFTIFSEPSLNNAGTIAFTGRAASGLGIYTSTGGALQTVALTGQAAPAIGGTFSDFTSTTFNKKPPALNNFGATAFLGISSNGARGLYLGDGQQLITAAYTGESLSGSTISGLTFTGGSDRGGAAQFNDNGQVTYVATLANGVSSVQLFTPTLHIRSSISGAWAARNNWTLGILPAAVHDVVIDPAAALTITGPMVPTTVKSLAVNGSGANVSELTLQSTGTITATGGASTGVSGRLGGSGKIVGNLTSAGTIAPGVGTTAGSVTVTGNVALQGSSHLAFDLGGLVRKTNYDFLGISGQFTLGGTLDVALMGGFVPQLGNTFDLFDSASVLGAFGTVNLPALTGSLSWNTSLLASTGVISVAGLSVTPTTYTLAAAASAATIHAGGSTTITATITNTGATGTDTLNYSGLNVTASPAGGTVSGVTLALIGTALANGNTAQSGTATFTSALAGTYTLTPLVASATNATLGSVAANAGVTAATVTVFSGAAKWSAAGPASWGAGANWTDTAAASVHAAPGTFSGFAASDSTIFDGTSGGSSVTLNGASPSLAALSFTGGGYTLAQGTGGTLTLNGGAGSATVTASAGSHTVSAPVQLATDASAAVTAAASTLTLGAVSGAGKTLTKTGAGTLILSGAQSYATLNANGGTTRVTGSFTNGTAVVHANATTKFEASQTLGALIIGSGVTVTFGNGAGSGFDDPSAKIDGLAVVPEPGAASLLLIGALGFLARRRRA